MPTIYLMRKHVKHKIKYQFKQFELLTGYSCPYSVDVIEDINFSFVAALILKLIQYSMQWFVYFEKWACCCWLLHGLKTNFDNLKYYNSVIDDDFN